METAVPTPSTPLRSPQVLGTDFDQRPNLDTSRRTFEEILAPDVIAEVREALKQDWFITGLDEHRREYERYWIPPGTVHPGSRMVQLYKERHGRDFCLLGFDKWSELSCCNKATAFYWMQSATVNHADFDGLAIIGGIWKTWADALGRLPHFQLDDFFAVPISVPKTTAKTVPEMLYAHKHTCSQVRETLGKKEVSAKKNPRYFRLHPLYEALFVVFDEYKYVPSGYYRQADGFRHYDNVTQHQSVLLVRTGKEDKLSAPISFDSLKNEALPLARNEDMGIIDIIRVPLQVSVRFIANLQLREEAAFPESVLGGPHISKEPDHPFVKCEREAFVWGESRLVVAQERGKISSSSTVSDAKEALLLYRNLDEFDLEFYAPPPGKHNWMWV